MSRSSRHLALAVLTMSVVLGACSGGNGSSSADSPPQFAAQVASYDVASGAPQRFLIGILGGDRGFVVYGSLSLEFRFLGADGTGKTSDEADIAGVTASFLPIAGSPEPPADATEPRLSQPSVAAGVYEATGVSFDRPGFWEATGRLAVDGSPVEVQAAFEVLPAHRIVTVGDRALSTRNLLPGDLSAPAAAVDSRSEGSSVPDPNLHRVTVADAIAAGKPTVVVISTPVFCVSRFCGPITDLVDRLAATYAGRANFVHIEVWRDYESQVLNRAAADWIYPDNKSDANEPWVFVIDRTGAIVDRFDNVVSDAELDGAVQAVVRP